MCFGFSSAIRLSFPSPPAQGPWFKTHTTALPFLLENNTKRGLGHLWSPRPPSVAHLEVVRRSSNWKSICLKLCIWHLARFIKSLEIAFNFTASPESPGTLFPLPPSCSHVNACGASPFGWRGSLSGSGPGVVFNKSSMGANVPKSLGIGCNGCPGNNVEFSSATPTPSCFCFYLFIYICWCEPHLGLVQDDREKACCLSHSSEL